MFVFAIVIEHTHNLTHIHRESEERISESAARASVKKLFNSIGFSPKLSAEFIFDGELCSRHHFLKLATHSVAELGELLL